jgi:hypothetical protein
VSRREDAIARSLRVREGASRGIRVVPADPDLSEFHPVPFACSVRPVWCDECRIERRYGVKRSGYAEEAP